MSFDPMFTGASYVAYTVDELSCMRSCCTMSLTLTNAPIFLDATFLDRIT